MIWEHPEQGQCLVHLCPKDSEKHLKKPLDEGADAGRDRNACPRASSQSSIFKNKRAKVTFQGRDPSRQEAKGPRTFVTQHSYRGKLQRGVRSPQSPS